MASDKRAFIVYAVNTDSNEFRREAEKMVKVYPESVMLAIDCGKNEDKHSRREAIKNRLTHTANIDLLAFICHGWREGIQFGFDLSNIGELTSAISHAANPNMRIALYCCSTANGPNGDGGFADWLRDVSGFQVDAHDGAGHCTSRPYVRRFDSGKPGYGGDWLISPQSKEWKLWYGKLKDTHNNNFRFEYPLMSREEILASLG